MSIILNGIAVGVFSAIFISLYAQGLLNYTLPMPLIYGIFAPLISAIAIFIMMLSKKDEKKYNSWTEDS